MSTLLGVRALFEPELMIEIEATELHDDPLLTTIGYRVEIRDDLHGALSCMDRALVLFVSSVGERLP